MADLAAKEAARNIDEASVTLTGDVPWYDKTHRPFTQNDEQQGQQQVQQGNTTTTNTQTAPAAPGATATQTEGGTRTRAAQHDRRDPPTHAHCPPPGRPIPAPSTTTTTASWAGSLMGSSAMPSRHTRCYMGPVSTGFRMACCGAREGTHDGLRTDSKCPLCQHEDGGSHCLGLPRQEMEKMYTSRQCSVATDA
jgi:hypothetical protein